jgi:GTPase SAR1 family protein
MGGEPAAVKPSVRKAAGHVLEATKALAAASDRQDLVSRLEAAARKLQDPSITVLVVGEYKKGKSSLVNGLLGTKVCPVDDDVATSVPTRIGYAKAAGAAIVVRGADGAQRVERVPPQEIASYIVEHGRPSNGQPVESVVIGMPHPVLASGLVLIDTPGVGGLGSAHTAATMAVLPAAQAVLLVSDASQEYTAPEIEFLRTARELCPSVACVLTKIDLYPDWRRIVELDRGHLSSAGIAAPFLAVSSAIRDRALARKDQALNDESGYPALGAFLQKDVVDAGEQLAVRAAASDVLAVVSQLEMSVVSEARALKDPASTAQDVARMQEAKEEAARLRGMSARWQTTLGDGFADLNSDVDFDFRRRTRVIIQEAEDSIDESDPGPMWEEFDAWLKRRAAADVGENYALLAKGVEEIARSTAQHFEGSAELIDQAAGVAGPAEVLEGLGNVLAVEGPKLSSLATHGVTAVKTAYSGFSMVGTLGRYAGLAMINPFSIGVGVLMAGQAVRDERKRALATRRQQAKAAVRKYIDDLTFQVGKDSRDIIRHAQRDLRDFFLERVDEMERTIGQAITSAQEAAKKGDAERQQQMKRVQEQAQHLVQIRKAAGALAPGLVPQPAS